MPSGLLSRIGPPHIAALCIITAVGVRGWVTFRGWFYIDDFAFMGRAMEHSLLSGDLLLQPYNSHLMPGSYVWVWLTTHAFPLAWWPVALGMVLLQLLLGWLTLRLLVELFGLRPLILPPLAVSVLSPISLPADVWWAAALNQLPQQIAMVASLLAVVRHMRTGSRRAAFVAPLVLAGGLLFSERTLLFVPVLVAVVLVYFTDGSLLQRVRRSVRRDALLWSGFAVVVISYLAYYVTQVPTPLRDTPTPGHDLADLLLTSIFRATIPGLIGGPFQWLPVGFAGALADPNSLVVVLCTLVVGSTVTATVLIHRGAAAAWGLLLAYVLANIAILSRSRATVIGPIIGTEYRYQTDVAVMGALMLAFASLPIAGRWQRGNPQRLRPRPGVGHGLEERVLTPLRQAGAAPAGSVVPLVAVASTLALAACSVVSTVRYDRYWSVNPARSWVQTLRADLAGLPPGTVLADGFVPQQVAWAFIYPYNESYRVLSPVLSQAQVLGVGASAVRIVTPDDDGHLRLALVRGARAVGAPSSACGWALGRADVTVRIPRAILPPKPVVRIGYLATGSTTLTMTANGRESRIPIAPGPGTAFVQVSGADLSSLSFSATGDGATVCTDDITVGTPVPVPGSTP